MHVAGPTSLGSVLVASASPTSCLSPHLKRTGTSTAKLRACRPTGKGRSGTLAGRACGCTLDDLDQSAEQPARRIELLGVAVAVLRGRVLDVGDPVAPCRGILAEAGVAGFDPCPLHGQGPVDEPLRLQLGTVAIAEVVARVPDPDAHLEEARRVGVAAGKVLDARLDERGHHGQLRWQPGLLRL